ncbi:Jerky protein [Chionoecetes opilio]|uniref:Jerky protein n=1 Tax=Chionoecetes opilio TaxID=41210 RepID=A0A8J4XPQ4_CHIOP|nr:Jerky protein [Chionoecetes opilio]
MRSVIGIMAPKRPGTPTGGSEKKRKNNVLTISEKIDLLKQLDGGTSVRNLCEIYGVGSSTVYDLKKQKTKLREFYARSETVKALMFREADLDDINADFDGFRVSDNSKHIRELMDYAKGFSHPIAQALDLDDVAEWMTVDDDAPVIQNLTTEEVVNMVTNPAQAEEDSDEDDVYEPKERTSIDKLLELGNDYVAGLEQYPFISEQDIMYMFNIQAKIMNVKPLYMKQKSIRSYFKQQRMQQHSTLQNPLPSSSSTPDILPVELDSDE